jgi:hypothetical protein
MPKLNLNTTTQPQKLILEYLEQSASDILADKINNGVLIEKDGKTLLNRKTLDGFMKYANDEARKMAEKGANCACIESNIVFGWAIHYFEEESIVETLYNEDGTEYKPQKATPEKTDNKKADAKKPEPKPVQNTIVAEPKPTKKTKKLIDQVSLFDII